MAEAAATPMTQDQLKSLVSDAVKDSVAAQVAAALEPLTKSTTDTLEAFKKSLKPSPEAHANDIEATDKEMGKYRFGRKARALALAAIEGVCAKDPDAVAHCVKAAWRPSLAE